MVPDAPVFTVACESQLETTRRQIARFEEGRFDSDLMRAWNRMLVDLNAVWQPASLWATVSPDPDLRRAAEKCDLAFTSLFNEITQSPKLYARFRNYVAVDVVDRSARESILLDFESSGVNLPAPARGKALAIFAEIGRLQQAFARNLRENTTRLVFTEEELKGVDPGFLAGEPRDREGRYLIGFDAPEADAVMSSAQSGAVRQRYSFALSRRGGSENLVLLNRIVVLRKELARLMGYAGFADWELRSHMAGSAREVNSFLAEIKKRVEQLERNELDLLTSEKARRSGRDEARLERWDVSYYRDSYIASHYRVDASDIRKQFPTGATVDWLLLVASRLYGLDIRPSEALPVWHEDVRGYDVYDKANTCYLGSFYLDLFPRDGKLKQDATIALRSGSQIEGITPVSVLVANFSRDNLGQEELSTLFHEFGHVMHGVLSRARYQVNAGTNVKIDFIEAPSQMFEEWVRRKEALALFTEACPSCRPVDLGVVSRMNEARQFGRGIEYGRQWLYAAYDMSLAGARPGDAMKTWSAMESASPLGHVEGTQFPGIFDHIVSGGYAAGYYGYMWSQVLALDMLSAFGDNVMDPVVGLRFRKEILEKGGEASPQALVRAFLGRAPSSQAFFAEITGQRQIPSVAQARR
ncbi:Zn-dependent oligopeptidase [Paludibacterium paludis]|uniref:Zn-dependent oligopeptidase n=1 Tax=Paludibacterium paludis TaxID=1225769 RepID=A0A918P088_9NEIS|nr:Zn-dependent oligopeptidase [Paludibacterium paludis]